MNRFEYPPNVQRLVDSVLNGSAESSVELRRDVEAFAASIGGGKRLTRELPEEIRPYIDKVTRQAYKVTDRDVDHLKAAGYSEDQLFELTISAALGAGLARLEKTMDLLGEV